MRNPENSGGQSDGNEIAPLIKMCSNCDDYFFLDATNSHVVDYDLENKKGLNHLYTCCPHCSRKAFQFTDDNPYRFVRYHTKRAVPVITMQEPYPLVEEIHNRSKKQPISTSEPELTPEQADVVKHFGDLLFKYIYNPADLEQAIDIISGVPNTLDLHHYNGTIHAQCHSCPTQYVVSNNNTELLIFPGENQDVLNCINSVCPNCNAYNYSTEKDHLDDVMRMGIKVKVL